MINYRIKWILILAITCSHVMTDSPHVSIGPIIFEPDKNEIILDHGQNYTLRCKGNRPLTFKQQNLPEEVVGEFSLSQSSVPASDPRYSHEIILELAYVDQYAVGYYGCFDDTIDSTQVLNDVTEEPSDTEHISYVYVYVNGSNSMFAPARELITLEPNSKVVIGCKPTSPDINVTISVSQRNKKSELEMISSKIGFPIVGKPKSSTYICNATLGERSHSKRFTVIRPSSDDTPEAPIVSGNKYFIRGENFTLNCTTRYRNSVSVSLDWSFPAKIDEARYQIDTNEKEPIGADDLIYKSLTIFNGQKSDNGTYVCRLQTSSATPKQTSISINFSEEAFLYFKPFHGSSQADIIKGFTGKVRKLVTLDAYPEPELSLYKNGLLIPLNDSVSKYSVKRDSKNVVFTIKNTNVTDTAMYTVVADNGRREQVVYDIRIRAAATATLVPDTDVSALLGSTTTLKCRAMGYPLPDIMWTGSLNATNPDEATESYYEKLSAVDVLVDDNLNISCSAVNELGRQQSAVRTVHVDETAGGFGIRGQRDTWLAEYVSVDKECLAAKYMYDNVTWIKNNSLANYTITYRETKYSHVAVLSISEIMEEDSGYYTCIATAPNGTQDIDYTMFTVEATRMPAILGIREAENIEVHSFQKVNFSCLADGVPRPDIKWLKDGIVLNNNSYISTEYLNRTYVKSVITIEQPQSYDGGKYVCVAENRQKQTLKEFNLIVKDHDKALRIGGGVAILVLIIISLALLWKIRKDRLRNKRLHDLFKKGNIDSLNADLLLDEQAEHLPYDEKYEFPRDKLRLGIQLGAGAFGIVYKAEARGIVNAEVTTTVAVKVVKKSGDYSCAKDLVRELKIMVHLGKHINVVNLLGACTKNIAKHELMVIVEYCGFGNLHEYLRKHRSVFVDTLTEDQELGNVNRGYSCSSPTSGMQSDYFGPNNTQNTDNTFLNTANTNRKISESSYVSCEPGAGDAEYGRGLVRPLNSRDLLCWAFQIARGMEYLASRKVLHGDLAARNVLLAEDNVVKICDFGLARSVYKSEEYLKSENSLLPVKWLAIECMTDRVFSTQSDVWSYGVLLWELFSLAAAPYPGVPPHDLLMWLTQGKRLEKPRYADERLHKVMLHCWEARPMMRPTFTELQEKFGNFLEESVRNHYVDLNATYARSVGGAGDEDYLHMVCTPDYKHMTAPSPHYYGNQPRAAHLPQDDDGYLQVSSPSKIFSPRVQGTQFDFEARHLNRLEANPSESELTPMLTLNGLPIRSNSESDMDSSLMPYQNAYPPINEEADEVFEVRNNLKNLQNGAVTNLTYISLDDKDPKSRVNNYANIGAADGLAT